MADEANRPLLNGDSRTSSPDRSSNHTPRGRPAPSFELSSESTPLLHRHEDDLATYGTEQRRSRSPSAASRAGSVESGSTKKTTRVPWPTFIALGILILTILGILVFAFAAPAIVNEYAQEAAVFKPTVLSIESTTPKGVRARVQGEFVMNSTRVQNKSVRDVGRFVTWIATEVETAHSDVEVYLPEYGNVPVGNASVPPIKVNIRPGHINHVDFLTDLTAGDIRGIHSVAMDWIEGRLGRLRIKGKTTMHLKTGLISLGSQILENEILFEENDFPALPTVDVTKLNVHDIDNGGAMAVDASVVAFVDSPLALTVPALGFEILVPNCSPGDPNILVAKAETDEIQIHPDQPIHADVGGLIQKLPAELTSSCPGEKGSPLDLLVSSFIQGQETTIYVRGASSPSPSTPAWLVDLLRSVTVPVPLTGHALDNLVKNFSMTDTHFSLPDPFAEPGTPESHPTVSALVKVLIALPEQMNFQVDVPQVRALADVFYKGKELGALNIDQWQDANSTLVKDQDNSTALLVELPMKGAPLQVSDDGLLAEVVQEMLFGSKSVVLRVAANVDAKVSTVLGQFAIREIPAEGKVRVNTPFDGTLSHLNPRVVSLQLENTTETSIFVSTRLNYTNPTRYAATIPFADLLVLYNGTAIAHVIARDMSVVPANNTNVQVDFSWSPHDISGINGTEAGRQLLSEYISGSNTTVTLKSHRGTIPSLPHLGEALSVLSIDIPVPRISSPDIPDGGNDGNGRNPHFIQDTTLHLWTSTAEFTLSSPLKETSIFITSVDATAFYEGDEPVGRINYKQSFEVPPGLSQTPRMPVDLALGSVGYEALRKALGHELEMDAVARVGVKVGNYRDEVIYRGKGIEAKVRV